jgi:hypothetical protein
MPIRVFFEKFEKNQKKCLTKQKRTSIMKMYSGTRKNNVVAV